MIEIIGSASSGHQLTLFPDDSWIVSLLISILREANGEQVSLSKYARFEIEKYSRKLIHDGYLRGTIIDGNNFVWSKITRKGRYLLSHLNERQRFSENYFITD